MSPIKSVPTQRSGHKKSGSRKGASGVPMSVKKKSAGTFLKSRSKKSLSVQPRSNRVSTPSAPTQSVLAKAREKIEARIFQMPSLKAIKKSGKKGLAQELLTKIIQLRASSRTVGSVSPKSPAQGNISVKKNASQFTTTLSPQPSRSPKVKKSLTPILSGNKFPSQLVSEGKKEIPQSRPILPFQDRASAPAEVMSSIPSQRANSTDVNTSANNVIYSDEAQIPTSYNSTWISLIPRDPHWVYAVWENSADSMDNARTSFGEEVDSWKTVLRMYDVTSIEFNGLNANHFFDIEINPSENDRYVNLWTDNVSYCAEMGLRSKDGNFVSLARSNVIQTPRGGHSWRTEQVWMEIKEGQQTPAYIEIQGNVETPSQPQTLEPKSKSKAIHRKYFLTDDDIRRYYSQLMPFLRKALAIRLARRAGRRTLGRYRYLNLNADKSLSGLPLTGWEILRRLSAGASQDLLEWERRVGGSENLLSSASLQKSGQSRKFFFELWTDLIVYGRTEPDAHVWLNEQKIPLRTDGTFTQRYTLPDIKVPLPFRAVSIDNLEERTIATEVERQTQYFPPKVEKAGV